MAENDIPLGAEDYQQLHQMLTSPDASTRVQGQDLAKGLSADQQQAFFSYQQQANKGKGERTRGDVNIGGLPPEVAAVGAASVAASTLDVPSLVGKVAAALKNSVGQAAPYVKYQAAKGMMRSMGIPEAVAEPVAWVVAGSRRPLPRNVETPIPSATTSVPPTSLPSQMPLVLSPAEAGQQDQLLALAKRQAQMKGMQSAAYGKWSGQ